MTAKCAAFVVLATVVAGAIFSTRAWAAQQAVQSDPAQRLLAERLGADDGYVASILYGSDIHGSLEPCG